MGSPKQLLVYQGRPMLRHVVENLLKSQVNDVMVVLGHQASKVAEALNELPVRIIINKDYTRGQSTSVRYGLAALHTSGLSAHHPAKGNRLGVLFVLGDQPLVKPETINLLIDHYRQYGGIIAPYYQGVRGNPVLFDNKFFDELQALTGDVGAREIISRYPEQLRKVEVPDSGVLQDIDTPEDYQKLI
jgi:molybdenum cofactor cytidylyltransferase